MTSPRPSTVDPRLVTALSAECESIGRQLHHMGRNLSILQMQLASNVAAPPVVASNAAPHQTAPPAPVYVQPTQFEPARPVPLRPARPAPPPHLATDRLPWFQRDGVISRLLAIAGVAVTLTGVVMLLVLAAQAGLFGPPLRVAGGAILSVALIVVALRVHARPGGTVGAVALAATGFAGLFLDVVAASVLYGWMITAPAVVIALGISAAGVAVAVKWDSEPLALMAVLGASVLAPVLTSGVSITLIAFLVAIQLGTFSVQVGRDWKYLGMARTVPAVLALLLAVASASAFDRPAGTAAQLVIAAALVAAVGFGSAAVLQRPGSPLRDGAAGAWSTASAVVAVLPLVCVGAVLEEYVAAAIYGAGALVLLSGSAVCTALPTHLRFGAAGSGSLALLLAVLAGATESLAVPAVLVISMVFLAVADRTGSRFVFALGAAFATLGAVGYLDTVPLTAMTTARSAALYLDAITALSSLVMIGVLVMLTWTIHRLGLVTESNSATLWAVTGCAALYSATGALVSSGVELFGGTSGFVIGHSVATVVWMLAATSALVLGLSNRGQARVLLGAGLTLTCAALAKLFLFDLATLSGLVRGSAFLVVGLLLLLVGTRYARAFGKHDQVSPASAER
ncbi:putative membrane protein [Rhodococcus sp. 27YEA15]|uniref:DUF2339 domain-containing protein n=1 Tax=Rhodococcus sp. 27YEA15 TaxID=3156259 RepID=UPI003C7C5774